MNYHTILNLNLTQKHDEQQRFKDPIELDLSETSATDLLLEEMPVVDKNMYCSSDHNSVTCHPPPIKKPRQNHKTGEILLGKVNDSSEGDLITEVELLLEDDSLFKKKTLVSCELCPSVFSSQSKLNDHVLKHTGERPFKCPLCSKSYPVKGEYKKFFNNWGHDYTLVVSIFHQSFRILFICLYSNSYGAPEIACWWQTSPMWKMWKGIPYTKSTWTTPQNSHGWTAFCVWRKPPRVLI